MWVGSEIQHGETEKVKMEQSTTNFNSYISCDWSVMGRLEQCGEDCEGSGCVGHAGSVNGGVASGGVGTRCATVPFPS